MRRTKHAFFIFLLVFVSCADTFDPQDVIKIRVPDGTTSIPADNNSKIELIAYIPKDADDDKRTIRFETTSGVFTENNEKEVELKAEDTLELGGEKFLSANVILKSSNTVTESLTVSAEIDLYPARTTLSFTEAPPTTISLSADKLEVTNTFDSELVLTALVKSDTGFPSAGSSVLFRIYDNSNDLLFTDVRFREQQLNINSMGNASAIFSAGNLLKNGLPFEGDLRIECVVNNNEEISDSILINVTSKTE
ncbi:hypothetical protein ABV409_08745 [Flagellimonas sp. DF-77]|uniref:hypothetical protein n=1 Tax=Flagellimonas algarum TaxID=3230298 RepID=UPI00339157FD